MKKKYRITGAFKILIAQFIISLVGLIIGYNWGLKTENAKVALLAEKSIKIGVENKQINNPTASNIAAQSKKNTDTSLDSSYSFCISSFSTNLGSSSSNRINNIETCVKAINDKLLMPGDIFSFNNIVGERTKERGYMDAPVIIDKRVQSDLGGGICQVSTTLYNAVLRAGITNIDRTHHSLPPAYVGLGLDATVDWHNIDFKFTNTLKYPIQIKAFVKEKKLYINILSNSCLNDKKYIILNNISEHGETYTAVVIRKTYENGKVTNIEHISDDVYVSRDSRSNYKY